MKKILLVLAMIMPIIALAQQKAPTSLTFCGIPLGLSTDDFKAKVDSKKVDGKLPCISTLDDVIYNVNTSGQSDYAYMVEVQIRSSRPYVGGFSENIIIGSLCAKYGDFSEYRNREGELRKIWFLKNGIVTMHYSTLQGQVGYVVNIIDYGALKKSFGSLEKVL